jgi:hypothetical protein
MEMVNTLIKSAELQNYMIDKSEQKGDCILRRLVASDAMINGHPAIVNGHLLGGAL